MIVLGTALSSVVSCSALRYGETVNHGAGLRETCEEITGRPNFTHSRGSEVEIQGDRRNRNYPISWPTTAPDPKSLHASHAWHFELLEQKGGMWSEDNSRTWTEISKVTDGSRVIYDAGLCPVHHLGMTRVDEKTATVQGIYRPPSFDRILDKEFPNTGVRYPRCSSGGERVVWVCPGCVKAKEQWAWRNRNSPDRFLEPL